MSSGCQQLTRSQCVIEGKIYGECEGVAIMGHSARDGPHSQRTGAKLAKPDDTHTHTHKSINASFHLPYILIRPCTRAIEENCGVCVGASLNTAINIIDPREWYSI